MRENESFYNRMLKMADSTKDMRNATYGKFGMCNTNSEGSGKSLTSIAFAKLLSEGTKMETEEIKNFKKDNLLEAKKEIEEKRKNFEIKEAAEVYESLINSKERCERNIKALNEELAEVTKELKLFNK